MPSCHQPLESLSKLYNVSRPQLFAKLKQINQLHTYVQTYICSSASEINGSGDTQSLNEKPFLFEKSMTNGENSVGENFVHSV